MAWFKAGIKFGIGLSCGFLIADVIAGLVNEFIEDRKKEKAEE